MIKLEKVHAGHYRVLNNGEPIGRVAKHGDIWKSYTMDMRKISSYNKTRKEAVNTLI